MNIPHIFVCIPAINEFSFIPKTLDCLAKQDDSNFSVTVCVNQPELWWQQKEKIAICENNHNTLLFLQNTFPFPLIVIDHSSPGKGWPEGDAGVGIARRTLMDSVLSNASPNDIIVSLDADTTFESGYLKSIRSNFQHHPKAAAISVPYYHRLTEDEATDRAILRYEIYMRNYAINLHRIQCPYNFTALGSAMAVTVKAYRAVGGITPKKSGEDFYFLQKLRKYGLILNTNEEKVYPAARFSDRVFFGTGPAMIKGALGDWESYPIYHYSLFDKVQQTQFAFAELFIRDIETPMTAFLKQLFNIDDLWSPLRANFTTKDQFIRACHEKVDALRILQYLKSEQKEISGIDENHLIEFFNTFYKESAPEFPVDFTFDKSSIQLLDNIRNTLVNIEQQLF